MSEQRISDSPSRAAWRAGVSAEAVRDVRLSLHNSQTEKRQSQANLKSQSVLPLSDNFRIKLEWTTQLECARPAMIRIHESVYQYVRCTMYVVRASSDVA